MQWNKTPGTVQIRITAVKDQARAGILSTQYLSDSVAPVAAAKASSPRRTAGTSGFGSPGLRA